MLMIRHLSALLAAVMAMMAGLQSAQAQGLSLDSDLAVDAGQKAEPAEERWQFMVGAGVAFVPDYEGSEDYKAAPLPLLRAQWGDMYGKLVGLKLSSNLIPHPNWRLGPVANLRGERDDVENDDVDDLKDIDRAFELGVVGGYDFELDRGVFSLELEFLADVTDEHDGWLLTPKAKYRRDLTDRLNFLSSVSLTFASDDYMETYFGIDNSDSARSGLDTFDADGGIKDASLALGLTYDLTDSWGIGVVGLYKRLLNDAEDSPVVDDVGEENQLIAALFTTYRF